MRGIVSETGSEPVTALLLVPVGAGERVALSGPATSLLRRVVGLDVMVRGTLTDQRAPVTPAVVARVLGHPEGGRKGAPTLARVAVIINKVDRLDDPAPARETAARLLENPAIDRVLLTSVRAADPVLEIHRR